MASSLVRVMLASLQLEGRLESLCLTSKCEHRILPSCEPAPSGLRLAELWYVPM